MSISPEVAKIIEEESQILEQVLSSLQSQEVYSQRKLGTESQRARELTQSIFETRRAEDKALIASDEAVAHALTDKKKADLKQIEKLVKRPYFGRIVLEENRDGRIKHIEYKIGLFANPDCRIIDWRSAPISKLYYEYKEGEDYDEEIQGIDRRGKILLRRTLEVSDGKLTGITCPAASVQLVNGEWQERSGSRRGSGTGGTRTLSDILPLITPEQFKTITEDAETAILIQGIAGSGKTTVALHRLAWLLSSENSILNTEECLVVVKSRPLKLFVSNILPSLGIEGIEILTLTEWAARSVKRIAPHLVTADGEIRRDQSRCPASVDRVKRSLAALLRLEQLAELKTAAVLNEIRNNLPWSALPAGIEALLTQGERERRPLYTIIADLQAGLERVNSSMASTNDRAEAAYIATSFLREIADRQSPAEELLLSLFDSPADIIALDETKLLGETIIRDTAARTRENRQHLTLDPADDGLLLRAVELFYGAPVSRAGKHERLKHIVFDEVQDSGPAELAAIIAAVENPTQLTLVGDIYQQIDDERTFPGWEKLRERWQLRDSIARYVSLTISHRSTLPIMRLAEHIQNRTTVTGGREGRNPIWFRARREEEGFPAAVEWLQKAIERYPGEITAVICADRLEAKQVVSLLTPTFGSAVRQGDEFSFSFDEGIVVSDIRQVKGLEFCNVQIWNPTKKVYTNDTASRNRLYVAVTRAIENLCIATWDHPPPLLPAANTKLLRYVDLEPEPEEVEEEPLPKYGSE